MLKLFLRAWDFSTPRRRAVSLLLGFSCLILVTACGYEDKPEQDAIVPQVPQAFSSESWRTVISDTCTRFFDGCNQCRRTPGTLQATCTRKACARYLEPKCLDEVSEDSMGQQPLQPKVEAYLCDGNNQFSIYYGTYITTDQRSKLTPNEVMLADRQTLSAHKLTMKMLGSVKVFTDGKIAFQSLGDEAQITLENELLYTGCKIRSTTE